MNGQHADFVEIGPTVQICIRSDHTNRHTDLDFYWYRLKLVEAHQASVLFLALEILQDNIAMEKFNKQKFQVGGA